MAESRKTSTPTPADRDLSVIYHVQNQVTQPLTQSLAISKYWEHIKDAQYKWWCGLIGDAHEFELVLISRNQVIASKPDGTSTVTEH